MSAAHDASPNTEPVTHRIDYWVRLEIVLDHPAGKVWPLVLHWDRWVNDTEFREYRIAGSLDTEGEIKKVIHFDDSGRLDFNFHAEVVKLVPQQRLIYKFLSPMVAYDSTTGAAIEIPYTGYEVFELREQDGKTTLTFDLYAEEGRAVALTKAESRRIAAAFVTATEERWYGRYFPRLKALLAGQPLP